MVGSRARWFFLIQNPDNGEEVGYCQTRTFDEAYEFISGLFKGMNWGELKMTKFRKLTRSDYRRSRGKRDLEDYIVVSRIGKL